MRSPGSTNISFLKNEQFKRSLFQVPIIAFRLLRLERQQADDGAIAQFVNLKVTKAELLLGEVNLSQCEGFTR
jgi:hypothetical protein